jgi:hypothetical protein
MAKEKENEVKKEQPKETGPQDTVAPKDEAKAGPQTAEKKPYEPKKAAPVRHVIAKGKAVSIPCSVPAVKDGYATTQDHERRITALEIAAGIKKIEAVEVK